MPISLTIPLSGRIDLLNLNKVMQAVNTHIDRIDMADKVVFDIQKCEFISAAAVIYLVHLRDEINDRGIKTFLRINRLGLAWKFIRAAKLIDWDEPDSHIKSLEQYTIGLERCTTHDQAANTITRITKLVNDHGGCIESTRAAADYLMYELADNAGSHGYRCYTQTTYPKPIYLGAYAYKNYFEIAIADRGVGICASLKQNNPEMRILKDEQALTRSIENGVSGHPKGSPGFGLYVTAEVVRGNHGNLIIWSSNRRLEVNQNNRRTGRGHLSRGTLVGLRLDRTRESPFDEVIRSGTTAQRLSAKDYLAEMLELEF